MVSLLVPPLRDRREDIPALIRQFATHFGKADLELPPGLMSKLLVYPWPGNVRELRNVTERALVYTEGDPLIAVGPAAAGGTKRADANEPFKDAKERLVEEFTRAYFTELLERHRGNITEVARASGIARNYVHRLIERYGFKVRR